MLLINYKEKKTLKDIIVQFDALTQNPFASTRSMCNSGIGSPNTVMINGTRYIIPSLFMYRFRSIYDFHVNEFKRARRKMMFTRDPMKDAALANRKGHTPYSLHQIKKDKEEEWYDEEFT